VRNSFEFRIVNWGNLYRDFLKSPLIGFGTGSWRMVNPIREYSGIFGGFAPHAETFGWLIQFGIIGALLLILFFLKSIIFYLKKARSSDTFITFGVIFPGLLFAAILGKALFYTQVFFILILIYFSCLGTDHK